MDHATRGFKLLLLPSPLVAAVNAYREKRRTAITAERDAFDSLSLASKYASLERKGDARIDRRRKGSSRFEKPPDSSGRCVTFYLAQRDRWQVCRSSSRRNTCPSSAESERVGDQASLRSRFRCFKKQADVSTASFFGSSRRLKVMLSPRKRGSFCRLITRMRID